MPKSPLVAPQTLLLTPRGSPTLAASSCQDNSICDTSPVGPSLGATYRRTHILLFLGHSFPLLYVSSPLFRLRTPALPLLLAFFYLSIGHGTTPLPLRPCARRCAFGYNSLHCFLYGHRTFLLTSPRGLSPQDEFSLIFLPLSPFCSPLCITYLYLTPSPGLGQGEDL